MALLCTLHADGPKTLRILREAGCTTIEKLRSLESDRLALLLSLSPAAARRLLREAALLEERLEPALEREEVMYPPAASVSVVKPAPPGFLRIAGDDEPAPAPAPPEAPQKPRSELDLRDRDLLERVVDRWRKADQEARADSPAALEPAAEPAMEAAMEPAMEEEYELEIPPPPPREQLRPGDVGGLDLETCRRLAGGGITSLEELATCPIDDLVTRTKLSFTRARTLQFLAGRRLTRLEEEASPKEPTPGPIVEPPRAVARPSAPERAGEQPLSISGSRSGAAEDGPGGPFA